MGVSEPGLTRRLAAVLCADAHGYSRMMQADEAATADLIAGYLHNVLIPIVEQNAGRVVKTMGDGLMAEFHSVVAAVQCAVDIQRAIAARNAGLPEGRRLEFRIGVNLGDVLVDARQDLIGEGVNLAARLEAMADPGSILISRAVYDQVRSRLPLAYEFFGQRQVKNMAQPVDVWRVGPSAAPSRLRTAHLLTPTAKPSIAVLPLTNMTGDPAMGIFCDDFSGGVIANLSRFHELFVIARHSSFALEGRQLSAAEIGQELGVRYLIEGSLSRTGEEFRIILQLIDTATSYHVWAEPFAGRIENILRLEHEVTRRVIGLLPVYIEEAEKTRTRRLETADLQSYGYLLRGLEAYREYTCEGHARAAEMFEKAIECDPTYARAYAALSRVHNHQHRFRWTDDPEASLRSSLRLAREAVRLDPTDPKGLSELGQVLLFMKNVQAAVSSYRRALTLNPNDADVMARLAEALVSDGKPEEALRTIEEAIRLNPFAPDEYLWFKADALFALERYRDVIETAQLMQNPSEADRLVAASYALLGELDRARVHAALVLQKHPDFRISNWIKVQPDSESPDCLRLAEGLRLAGLPG